MHHAFFSLLYENWKPLQLEKYAQLLPLLKEHVKRDASVLDLGIGRAWLETFLQENGFAFPRVVGVEEKEMLAEPRAPGIEYVFTPRFDTAERFDFVAAFDSAHLLPDGDVARFAKQGGVVLLSAPASQAHRVPAQKSVRVVAQGEEGALEKLIEYLHKGPFMARVSRVSVSWREPTGDFRDFVISY